MINNNENVYSIIRSSAIGLFPDCKVLLFGSRVRGDHSFESDYDLLLIIKNNLDFHEKRYYQAVLRKELAYSKIPADVMIHSEAEVEIKRKITGHILKTVMKEGIFL